MNDIFSKDLNGEMVSPDEPGYDALIDDIFATITARSLQRSAYATRSVYMNLWESILGKELPESTTVLPPFYIDYGKPVTIGERCFIQQCCTFFGRGGIEIGHDVFYRPEGEPHNHQPRCRSRQPQCDIRTAHSH